MKRSQELIQEESHYFAPAGRIPYYPLVIDHAHGSTLTDVDGNEYLDLLTSASALNVGHTPEPIVNTIIAQVKKMIHYTPAYMYHEPLVHLAKKMCEITPGDFEKRVIFGLTGSDANDALIKFARG
ncbi:MAG: aminotransferase class III-fold pyridoxal phosphate-dependent enzyme, partial [Streptococcus vestibularis]|nr:aminotransferase class III-fold pyridoxal phosphate-dependent enzyme [Streptococcus vestibularis]